jgi:hypothetical protein
MCRPPHFILESLSVSNTSTIVEVFLNPLGEVHEDDEKVDLCNIIFDRSRHRGPSIFSQTYANKVHGNRESHGLGLYICDPIVGRV